MIAVVAVSGACIPDVTVDDPNVQLLCDDDDDCPDDFACKDVDDEQRCVALSVLSKTPIELRAPLTLDVTRLSSVAGSNVVTARFTVSEAPAAHRVVFDDVAMGCESAADDDGVAFTCSFTVAAGTANGAHTVSLFARDAAANVVRDAVEVVVDAEGPAVAAATVVRSAGREGFAPAGAVVVIAIAFNEVVDSASLSLGPDEGCDVVVEGTTVTCTATPGSVEGPRTLSGTAVDTLGNVAEIDTVLALVVDATAPGAPAVDVEDAVIYRRAPWGVGDSSTPSYVLDVDVDAVEAEAFVAVFADAAGALPLSTGAAGSVDLGASDHSAVFVAAVDRAGNRSAIVAVQQQSWTATLGNKRGTRRFENPHRVFAVADSGTRLLTDDDTELADVTALSPGAAGAVTATSTPTWTQAFSPTLPVDRREHCQAFDAARGEVVVFGGDVGGNTLVDETWVYSEGVWRQRSVTTRPTPRKRVACAYDPLRDRVVLVGGEVRGGRIVDEIWEWDGLTWSRSPVSMPAPVASAAAAFSVDELAVVVVGGVVGNAASRQVAVVRSDSVVVDSEPALPARTDAAAATDVDGTVVVFGGSGLNDTWRRVGGAFVVVEATPPASSGGPSMAVIGARLSLVTDSGVVSVLRDGAWTATGASTTVRPGARLSRAGDDVGLYFGGAVNEPTAAGLHLQGDVFRAILDGAVPTGAGVQVAWDDETRSHIVVDASGIFVLPSRRTLAFQPGTLVDSAAAIQGAGARARALLVRDNGTVSGFTGDEFLQLVSGSVSPVSPASVVRTSTGLVLVNQTQTWRLDDDDNTWSVVTDSPDVSGFTLAVLDDRVLLIGGLCGVAVCTSGFVLDDDVWTPIELGAMPPRANAAAASFADEVLIFGGFDFSGAGGAAAPRADFWSWDGTTFSAVDVDGPGARFNHAMAADPRTGQLLLVGGTADGTPIGDVWSYDTAAAARPAVLVAVTVGAAQVDLSTLTGITFDVDAATDEPLQVWQAGTFVDVVGDALQGADVDGAVSGDEATLYVRIPAATTGPDARVDVDTFAVTFSFRSTP